MAKSDKAVQRLNLSLFRSIYLEGTVNIIDQWGLIHCGMAAVCHTARHPEIWEKSFIAVNLHPKHMLPFKDWCKKIEPFMQASDSFDLVTQEQEIDEYTLLPSYWHAMTPAEKRVAVSVVRRLADNAWSVECIQTLHTECSIPYSDMCSLQACVWLAMENPSHLDRGLPEDELEVRSSNPDRASFEEVGASMFQYYCFFN